MANLLHANGRFSSNVFSFLPFGLSDILLITVNGNLKITNLTTENYIFVRNCLAGEVITLDGEYGIQITSMTRAVMRKLIRYSVTKKPSENYATRQKSLEYV